MLLYLEPLAFATETRRLLSSAKQKSPMMVFNHLGDSRCDCISLIAPVTQAGWSPQASNFHEHFLKIIVFGLVRGFVVNSVIVT
ncbi:MAG: hypothetical protein R3F40_13125 [Candidatus Competibacteraceae bacterium]